MPVLLGLAGEQHPVGVRAEAVDGIKSLLVMTDGTTRPDVADAMAKALESRDRWLLARVLQALFYVHAPMPLARLLELLGDERPLGWDDYRVCDNTLWILMRQLGMNLERADGTLVGEHCSREIAAFLRGWYSTNSADLRWDAEAKCYRASPR